MKITPSHLLILGALLGGLLAVATFLTFGKDLVEAISNAERPVHTPHAPSGEGCYLDRLGPLPASIADGQFDIVGLDKDGRPVLAEFEASRDSAGILIRARGACGGADSARVRVPPNVEVNLPGGTLGPDGRIPSNGAAATPII